jgi:hypothetical protein
MGPPVAPHVALARRVPMRMIRRASHRSVADPAIGRASLQALDESHEHF